MKLSGQQLLNLIPNSYVDHGGKNINGDCPQCGHAEFGISLIEENHPFNCYRKKRCGFAGNIYTLLKYLGKSKEFLSERPVNIFDRVDLHLDEEKKELQLELPSIPYPPLWRRVDDDPYLRSRGFVDNDFEKYEVGRSVLKKDYVTFLVRMNGSLVGYISRSEISKARIDAYNEKQKAIDGEMYRRYDNSLTDFSKMLFGYDEIVSGETTDVILVEGIFSKTKTDTNLGLDVSNKWKCCATFGAKISPEQIELLRLKGVKNIWLWFEADVLDKVKDVAGKMASYFNVRVSYLNGVDPNEIGPEEAVALIDTAKNYLDFNVSYVKFGIK